MWRRCAKASVVQHWMKLDNKSVNQSTHRLTNAAFLRLDGVSFLLYRHILALSCTFLCLRFSFMSFFTYLMHIVEGVDTLPKTASL